MVKPVALKGLSPPEGADPSLYQTPYDPGMARSLMSNPLFMAGLGMMNASMGNIASGGRTGGNPAGGLLQGLQMAGEQDSLLRQNSLMNQLLMRQGVHGVPDRESYGIIPGATSLLRQIGVLSKRGE